MCYTQYNTIKVYSFSRLWHTFVQNHYFLDRSFVPYTSTVNVDWWVIAFGDGEDVLGTRREGSEG